MSAAGGHVLHAQALIDRSVDAAGRAASVDPDPLPDAGFERALSRELRIVLRAD